MNNSLSLLFLFFISFGFSQEKLDLFSMIETEKKEIDLLPEKMVFTQRLLWGEKGLFRKTGIVELNLENRQKELKLRKSMLTTHQVLGYLTLASMIAQGIIGGKLYNGDNSLYKTHKTMGKVVNAGYFTGAALSLFSPPPLTNPHTKGDPLHFSLPMLSFQHTSSPLSIFHFPQGPLQIIFQFQ